jgi:hypothetical protein
VSENLPSSRPPVSAPAPSQSPPHNAPTPRRQSIDEPLPPRSSVGDLAESEVKTNDDVDMLGDAEISPTKYRKTAEVRAPLGERFPNLGI